MSVGVINVKMSGLTILSQKLHFLKWKQIKCAAITFKISGSLIKYNPPFYVATTKDCQHYHESAYLWEVNL